MVSKHNPVPLIIRADADAARGAGHVMRSLALAYAWQARGGFVSFVSKQPTPPLRRKIQAAGATVVELDSCHPDFADVQSTVTYVDKVLQQSQQLPWIVLDGYHFDRDYQNRLRATGARLVVIDDNAHLPFYDADIVLNHGMQAAQLEYRCAPGCELLLGTRYALLRPEFARSVALEKLLPHKARNLLVTLGGSDPDNVTEKVLQALALIDCALEVRVVVGPMNPHIKTLQSAAAALRHSVHLETAVQDMAAAMLWADLAVSAAGGTCLELAALGVPIVALVVAENQQLIAVELDKSGAAINLGGQRQVSVEQLAATLSEVIKAPQVRAHMRQRGKALVDGRGAQRVVEALLEKANARGSLIMEPSKLRDNLTLRPATANDSRLLWQWANDPVARANSFRPEPIPWAAHREWFAARLASADCRIWILEAGDHPVAQIRYERHAGDGARISYSVDAAARGHGFGGALLEMSFLPAVQALGVPWVSGVTFAENIASSQAFRRAGFELVDQQIVAGKSCQIFRRYSSLSHGDVCGAGH